MLPPRKPRMAFYSAATQKLAKVPKFPCFLRQTWEQCHDNYHPKFQNFSLAQSVDFGLDSHARLNASPGPSMSKVVVSPVMAFQRGRDGGSGGGGGGGDRGVVGFLGLDELSLEMAASLICSGYKVQAFQAEGALVNEFLYRGGTICASPIEAGKDAAALIVLGSCAEEINTMIFGEQEILKGLPREAIIILRSTIQPENIWNLEKTLAEDGMTACLVDAYVCRGISDMSNGRIMITSSGRSEAIGKALPILSAMCEKLIILEGEAGAGSKFKMVDELLQGIHLVSSVEAISLAAEVGIHPWIFYDIVANASGNSWVFKNHIPGILRGDTTTDSYSNTIQNLGTILDLAKSLAFPLPLLATSHQQLILGSSYGCRDNNDVALVKVWEKIMEVDIQEAARAEVYSPEELARQITANSVAVKRIGFIGLGAMGLRMATHLLKSNFHVLGYDVHQQTLTQFANAGGSVCRSTAEVAEDVDVIILMVTNEAQVETVLYGDKGAVPALPSGASIIVSSTLSPGFMRQLERRIQSEGKDLMLVDAPVTGGVKGASNGTLTIMASGTNEALQCSGSILSALSEKLYIFKGGCGAGSGVKMVNQLLAGVNLAAAAEAMAFGSRLGLNTRMLFDFILNSGGASWMLEDRVPHMLNNDYTPCSVLDTLVKDLGIVTHECTSRKIPVHMATTAHQLFLAGSAAGWGRLDDASIVKVYETLTGVKVEAKLPPSFS